MFEEVMRWIVVILVLVGAGSLLHALIRSRPAVRPGAILGSVVASTPPAGSGRLMDENAGYRQRQLAYLAVILTVVGVLVMVVSLLAGFPLWAIIMLTLLAILGVALWLSFKVYKVDAEEVMLVFYGNTPQRIAGRDDGWLGMRYFLTMPWERHEGPYKLTPYEEDLKVGGKDGKGVMVKGTRWVVNLQVSYHIVELYLCTVVNKGLEGGKPKWQYRLRQRVEGVVAEILGQLELDEVVFMQRATGNMKITDRIVRHQAVRANLSSSEQVAASVIEACLQEMVQEVLDQLGVQITAVEVENVVSPDSSVMDTLRDHELRFKRRETDEEAAAGEKAKAAAAAAGEVAIIDAGKAAGWDGAETGIAAHGVEVYAPGKDVVVQAGGSTGGKKGKK